MAYLAQKTLILCMTIALFWGYGIGASRAQILSPDPEVVTIKAIDAPSVHTLDGKTGFGSEIRKGQGIIIDPSGIIATNRHIIGDAQHILVTLSSGVSIEAKLLLIGQTDVCLIKIDTGTPVQAVSMSDDPQIHTGTNVVAFANGDLNPQRIKDGKIIQVFTGVNSNNAEILETNIPLKPGDSGGPILDENGSLLGLIMATQISDPSKSFAIASSRIKQEYFNYKNSEPTTVARLI